MAHSAQNKMMPSIVGPPPPSPLYTGVVEYVHDPLQMGRVKVRIPSEHGDVKARATEELPWAPVANMGGGGADFGSFLPLQVGAWVWVMLVNNDIENPVIVGTQGHSIPKTPQVYGQAKADLLPIEEADSSANIWRGADVKVDTGEAEPTRLGQPEALREVRQMASQEPTISVPFKTYKGAALVIEDADGKERMELLDRAGQGLQMKAPIDRLLNKSNNYQRGLRSAFRGDQFNYQDATDNRESSVSLRDLAQQGIHMQARKTDERVKVVSKVPSSSDGGFIDFEMGDVVHSIELGAGAKRTLIQGMTRQGVMFRLVCDSERGVIEIESKLAIQLKSTQVSIVADRIALQGEMTLDGNAMVTGDLTVAGKVREGSPTRDRPINYR